MPSGIDIGNAVVNAYLSGVQLRRQNETQAAELDLKRKAQEESIKQFEAQLKERQQEFSVSSKLNQAQFEAQQAQARAQLKFQYATAQNPIASAGEEGVQEIDTGLGGGPASAWSPAALQKFQADRLAMQGKAAATQAAQVAEATLPTQEKLETTKSNLRKEEQVVKNTQQVLIEEMKERGAAARADAANAARIRAAGIAANSRLQAAKITSDVDPNKVQEAISLAYTGEHTHEELMSMLPQKSRLAVSAGMKAAGIGTLDKDSKAKLVKLGDVAGVAKDIEWVADYLKQHGAIAAGRNAEFRAKVDGINLQLPNITKSVGGDSGVLSNQDIGRGTNVLPNLTKQFLSILSDGNLNQEDAKNFTRIVKRAVSNTIRIKDVKQANAIADTYKLPHPFDEDDEDIDLRPKGKK